MRVLLLTHSFNSLAQRLFVELSEWGHTVSVELDVNDAVTLEAVDLFRPDLILAPYLKRALPEPVWRRVRSLVLHPGPRGDRGPSALDWAILDGVSEWGVTVLEANDVLDGGPTWAEVSFPMRAATKSSLYRHEVTEAAVDAVRLALARMEDPSFSPRPLDAGEGRWRPLVRKSDRQIHWRDDTTETILRKIRSGDGSPGACAVLDGREYRLFNASHARDQRGEPGTVLGFHQGGVCLGTCEGAIRVTHVQAEGSIKMPAWMALGHTYETTSNRSDITYEESDGVGHLHFDFTNGAMGVVECVALREAFRRARSRDIRVIVLHGGPDFWSNGIHLNVIEAAESPADASWDNINAMNDLALEILMTTDRIVIAALNGNAAAGGCFLALTADRILMRRGVILNPHYRNMGNLYGSEYWTYSLPRRLGENIPARIMNHRLPLGATEAKQLGLVDLIPECGNAEFGKAVRHYAEELARSESLTELIRQKTMIRSADEARKPLAEYRREELDRMRLNFYGCDPSYHVARSNFVRKVPHSRTPLWLAAHRRSIS